jgi:hypothetical protein
VTSRLRDGLQRDFGGELQGELKVAVTAYLGFTRAMWLWALVGLAGGLVAHYSFGLWAPLAEGAGAGLGISLGMVLEDRRARGDERQPGGLYVVLGATESHMVVFTRPLWSLRARGHSVARSLALTELSRVEHESKGFGRHRVTLVWQDGSRWSFEVNRWERLRDALPHS